MAAAGSTAVTGLPPCSTTAGWVGRADHAGARRCHAELAEPSRQGEGGPPGFGRPSSPAAPGTTAGGRGGRGGRLPRAGAVAAAVATGTASGRWRARRRAAQSLAAAADLAAALGLLAAELRAGAHP